MDKEEYRVRLETIKTLANDGDFKAAAAVADTIDWKRVRSVRTLCMIGEIYEASSRYEDTIRVLQYAYFRASTSKTVLYRLAEVSMKAGHPDDAEKYCEEFETVSPKDSTRYILRYKLMKARGDSPEEQIKMLEAYRESEFTERWAYELALLYRQCGRDEDCVRLCDDMILWFSEGRYVTKAMELKMQIRPLSAEQLKKYNARDEISEEEDALDEPDEAYRTTAEEREAAFRAEENTSSYRGGAGDMQSRLAQGLRSVFAGIRQDDREEQEEENENEGFLAEEPELPENPPAAKLEPEEIRNVVRYEPKPEEPEDAQLTLEDVAKKPGTDTLEIEELLSETQMNLASAVASGEYVRMDAMPGEEDAALPEDAGSVPAGQMSFADLGMAEEEREAAEKAAGEAAEETAAPDAEAGEPEAEEAAEEPERPAEELDPYARLYGKETDESLGLTRQFNLQEEVAQALSDGGKIVPEDEETHRRAVDKTLRSAGILRDDMTDLPAGVPAETEENAAEGTAAEEAPEAAAEEAATEEKAAENAGKTGDLPEDDPLIRDIIEEPERLKVLPLEPRPLTDKEKEIFTYFSKIPGMSEQITVALADVHNHAGEKTSRAGNIMIIGRQGSGKTRLSDALMLGFCRDLGIPAVRCAKVIAADLNEKSPAEVVSRLMGGFLVIEGAGAMNDDTVEKLLRAMEFRTDGLVVVLEDEKADLKELLVRHPEIEDKFTSSIVIPVFTNDELVTFAKTYAKEKGYRMDELGILALYTMIGDNQTATEPVTVRRVKEMMDTAISRAESGTRRIGRRFSKRATDKDGRVLLHEKDFDF